MTTIRLLPLFLLLALTLAPSLALADDGATPEALIAAWGNWPVFVGVAVALFVRAWQVARPLVWDSVASRWRPLIAIGIAGLPAFSIALLSGASWGESVLALLTAWVSATGAAEALRLALGKGGA